MDAVIGKVAAGIVPKIMPAGMKNTAVIWARLGRPQVFHENPFSG